MVPSRMLDLLEKGEIEEVKLILRNEIYMRSMKKNPNSKKRYVAMNKYFSYRNSAGREVLTKPCQVEFEGKEYLSFTNSYSMIFTTESAGNIELFDTETGNYPNVASIMRRVGDERKLDITEIIAQAKSHGYKLLKREVSAGYRYLLLYDGSYYNIGLLDISYRLLDDGKEVTAYHKSGPRSPLTIENDIGLCMIMPVAIDGDVPEGITVIELEET